MPRRLSTMASKNSSTKAMASTVRVKPTKVVKPLPKHTPERTLAPFRGVTEVDVAPVSLGNTIRSVKQRVEVNGDTVRVIGRDYVSTVGGTIAAFNNWTFQTGMAFSPIALNASGLRGYFQSYQKYKWNRAVAHYITSSPTSTAGDVLIFYHANHGGPKVDSSSSNFLSYALSTDCAVLGPQWTNHGVPIVEGKHEWLNTDVLNAEDVQHQADGELLVYTRNTFNAVTSSADSPGYLLLDYDISFQNRMLNSRVNTIPSSLFKWFPTGFRYNNGPVTGGDVASFDMGGTVNYLGVALNQPAGAAIGMIYQVVFDVAQSVVTGTTLATAFQVQTTSRGTGTFIAYPIVTGTTLYATCGSASGSGAYSLHPSFDAAAAGVSLIWASTGTPAISMAISVCCVGSLNAVFTQANIG